MEPGSIVPVEIEIWPTSVVFEPGERLVLEVASEDDPRVEPFLHNDPVCGELLIPGEISNSPHTPSAVAT